MPHRGSEPLTETRVFIVYFAGSTSSSLCDHWINRLPGSRPASLASGASSRRTSLASLAESVEFPVERNEDDGEMMLIFVFIYLILQVSDYNYLFHYTHMTCCRLMTHILNFIILTEAQRTELAFDFDHYKSRTLSTHQMRLDFNIQKTKTTCGKTSVIDQKRRKKTSLLSLSVPPFKMSNTNLSTVQCSFHWQYFCWNQKLPPRFPRVLYSQELSHLNVQIPTPKSHYYCLKRESIAGTRQKVTRHASHVTGPSQTTCLTELCTVGNLTYRVNPKWDRRWFGLPFVVNVSVGSV